MTDFYKYVHGIYRTLGMDDDEVTWLTSISMSMAFIGP